MKVLVCGADGYLGAPLVAHLKNRGHRVIGVDNFLRRKMVAEIGSQSAMPIPTIKERRESEGFGTGDITDYDFIRNVLCLHKPESIVNLAQIPSAPYSMIDAQHANLVQKNNNVGLMNLLWASKKHVPETHITTLATMGEYGTPNIPIPEGFFEIEYQGMRDTLPFPRQGGSFYHISKIQSTHNVSFACKIWKLKSTDIHQGVVYGTRTEDTTTRFDFDECFGTMINRAVACAVINRPIIPYGLGQQKRGYIALRDSIQCLTISVENPPNEENYRVWNQFDECYRCNQIAEIVAEVGKSFSLNTSVENRENPRIESERHFYQPHHGKLHQLGFRPTMTLLEELKVMFKDLIPNKQRILKYADKIEPTIRWGV